MESVLFICPNGEDQERILSNIKKIFGEPCTIYKFEYPKNELVTICSSISFKNSFAFVIVPDQEGRELNSSIFYIIPEFCGTINRLQFASFENKSVSNSIVAEINKKEKRTCDIM